MNPDENIETTYVEGEAGAAALETVAKKFADMTATEVRLGFGDCHCDYRAPLAQVKIYKEAEDVAKKGEKFETDDGEKTAEELVTSAMEMHNPTPGKVEMLEKFYKEDSETGEDEKSSEETD